MRVGVTGIYSSGKGTVCEIFEELGASVIDTDIIARKIVEPGERAYSEIVETFGEKYLNEDKTLNRRALAFDIFKDEEKVKKLNSITHPAILERSMTLSSDNSKIYMINTPLLFESGFDKYMDKTITVVASTEQAIERGIKRDNLTEKEIIERLNNQISLNEKIERSDYVIDNSKSLENTRIQVEQLWKTLTLILNQ